MSTENTKKELNRKASIAGLFFILAQLLVRGVTFIVTPIYTRMVTTAQYGQIRVFESWLLILVPLLSLSLFRSVERAKFDFPDEYESYVASTVSLSFLSIAAAFTLITLLLRRSFMRFCSMDGIMYVFAILHCFSYCSVLTYQRREKQMMRYKNSTRLTVMTMLPATILSILLIYLGNRGGHAEKAVDLRVIGFYSPQIIGGLWAASIILRQGKRRADRRYWKYALAFSLPLIPEMLSIQIMNQSDKIMIQKMVSDESTGIFALATTVSFIIWIVEDAVWGAWQPWLYEKLARGEVRDIQKPWTFISLLFSYFSWMLVVLAPEIILILGGKRYAEAAWLVAPMVMGTLFRFFSYGFSAVENYQKKTRYCAIGTVAAMIINVILNWLCIRAFGYQAAAYTTAFSYFLLLVIQGWMEKTVCGMRCISMKQTVLLSFLLFSVNMATMLLFRAPTPARWGVAGVISLLVLWRLLPQMKSFISLIRER